MSHRCPAPGCPRRVRDDVWSCRDHWWALPHRIRVRLSRTRDGNTSQLAAVDAAAAARADAVAWWAAHPDAGRPDDPAVRPCTDPTDPTTKETA